MGHRQVVQGGGGRLADAMTAQFDSPATLSRLLWAGVASTLQRFRRGEGALLAVNFSLVVYLGAGGLTSLAQIAMSVLAIGLMYAFNDLYDAPGDRNNPRKDRDMIATYIEHRRTCGIAILVLSLLTVLLASLTLGVAAGAAVGGVMLVNLVYSVVLKGVPVLDVAWCGLWGTLYAAIVGPPLSLAVLVGVITSVCHLYQTLDDRAVDAANGITTTAVRSLALSRNVLAALCVLLFVALRPALGAAWALSAFTPLLFFFAVGSPLTGWLLTKAYFAVVWLAVLGTHAPD